MRALVWTVCLLLLGLFFVAPATLYMLTVEARPIVSDARAATAADAGRARAVLQRFRQGVHSGGAQTMVLTAADFDALAAFARRALPWVEARVNVGQTGLVAAASARLPKTPLGSYVNVRMDVLPSQRGLDVAMVQVGRLRVDGALALTAAGIALDLGLGRGQGAAFIDSVRSVAFSDDQVRVALHVDREMLDDARDRVKEQAKAVLHSAQIAGDPVLVRIYYGHIVEAVQRGELGGRGSLLQYVRPVMQLAEARSRDGDPVEENRAAIMALAMYCGTVSFESLVGEVRTGALRLHKTRCERATLGGRVDLRLHFLYSAALKIASDRGIAFAIGEFKELLDSQAGGSGFSFSDLLADRAGLKLAELATGRTSARRLQAALAAARDEREFFPDVAGLPDGLSDADFRSRFGNVESASYRALLDEIDERIGRSIALRDG